MQEYRGHSILACLKGVLEGPSPTQLGSPMNGMESSCAVQAGWQMHNYPEVMFRAVNFSTEGQACMADKPPTDRRLTFNSASNLYSDAEAVGFLLLSTYTHSSPRRKQSLHGSAIVLSQTCFVHNRYHSFRGNESLSLLQVLVNLHLAPFPKPASSIVDDFPTEQNHKGWQVTPHRLAPDWPGPES